MPIVGPTFNLVQRLGTGTPMDNMLPPLIGADLDDIATSISPSTLGPAVAPYLVVPAFSVTKSGNQTITDSVFTLVTWETVVYDIGSHFASNGWTPPAGKVHINAGVQTSGVITNGSNCTLVVQKNGVNLRGVAVPSWGGSTALPNCAFDDVATGTDVYTVTIFQAGSVGTLAVVLSVGTFFSGHWFSA